MVRSTWAEQRQRQGVLKGLIEQGKLENQSHLVALLAEKGFVITQSSLSRDLSAIGAQKIDGHYRIIPFGEVADREGEKYPSLSELHPFVRSYVTTGPHLVVVSTRSGLAQTVALALDEMAMPEIAGTIAGDDTVFVATATRRAQVNLIRRFEMLLPSSEDEA